MVSERTRKTDAQETHLLLPALLSLRPKVAVSALATLGCALRVSGIAVHADGLVKESALCLFKTCHGLFL